MPAESLLSPIVAMLLLTMVVWVVLFAKRMSYIGEAKLDAQELQTPEKAKALIPEAVQFPAHNFANLFEMPVVFYAVCLVLYGAAVQGLIELAAYQVYLAWGFVALRVVHSAIQCTVNKVMPRFIAYLFSSLCAWGLVVSAALALMV